MGFLDHSTNNIILDAVLTDTGRQFLSRNDGSFSILKFALSDDEVNYGIITKYGRSVGREKIEKNTPIFEALTVQSQSQKYKLISVSNPNLIRLPKFTLTGDSSLGSNGVVSLFTGQNNKSFANLTITQKILNETIIDPELVDEIFILDVPNLFFNVNDSLKSVNIDAQNRAYYSIQKQSNDPQTNGAVVSFKISLKSLTQNLFDVYGYGSLKNKIKTYIRITGVNSGAVSDISIDITQKA